MVYKFKKKIFKKKKILIFLFKKNVDYQLITNSVLLYCYCYINFMHNLNNNI